MSLPARQVCKVCGYDDDVAVRTIAPGLWEYFCSKCDSTWESSTANTEERAAADGITAELGVYDDLLQCLVRGEPFVEYGVIEDRYSRLRPRVYRDLIDRYGHRRSAHSRYTASVFLDFALGRVRDRGELLLEFGAATGYWSYNGNIGYCALPPGPANGASLTYIEYALANGIDPNA